MKGVSFFQAVLLTVFILGGIIGIFVFSLYRGGASDSAIGPVVIWGLLPQSDFSKIMQAVTLKNEDLKSVTYVEKGVNAFKDDLVTAIATNAGPDLILITQEQLAPLTKFIQPIPASLLPESSFVNTFAAGTEVFLVRGTTGSYGIPWLIDPLIMFTNRAILNSTGIAEAPKTWEALTGLVVGVVGQTETQNISRGLIALGTYDNVHNARGILSTLFMQTGIPIFAPGQNGRMSANLGALSKGNAPSGKSVLQFYTQFADSSKVSYTWNSALPDSQSAFISGDLALYLGFASEARHLRAANPNLDFGVAPIPQRANASIKQGYGLIYAFAIPRGAKNSAGASAAAVALVGADNGKTAALTTSLAPSRRSLLATPPSDPLGSVVYTSALFTKGWLSPTPLDTDQVFSAMINDVISGRLTPEAALSTAENSLNAYSQK